MGDPGSYGNDEKERAAIRDRVAIADITARAKVDVRGELPETLVAPAERWPHGSPVSGRSSSAPPTLRRLSSVPWSPSRDRHDGDRRDAPVRGDGARRTRPSRSDRARHVMGPATLAPGEATTSATPTGPWRMGSIVVRPKRLGAGCSFAARRSTPTCWARASAAPGCSTPAASAAGSSPSGSPCRSTPCGSPAPRARSPSAGAHRGRRRGQPRRLLLPVRLLRQLLHRPAVGVRRLRRQRQHPVAVAARRRGSAQPRRTGLHRGDSGLVCTTAGIAIALDATRRLYTDKRQRPLVPSVFWCRSRCRSFRISRRVALIPVWGSSGLPGVGGYWCGPICGLPPGEVGHAVWIGLGVLVRPEFAIVTAVFIAGWWILVRPGRGGLCGVSARRCCCRSAYEVFRAG